MRHFSLGRPAVWAAFAVSFLFMGAPAGAADTKKDLEAEKEAKQAAEEESREQRETGWAYKPVNLRGRISLLPIQDGDTANTVAGSFATQQGTFLLKFEKMDLRRLMLREYNNKDITLVGKVRNEGKYFVAVDANTPSRYAVPAQGAIKPGGL